MKIYSIIKRPHVTEKTSMGAAYKRHHSGG